MFDHLIRLYSFSISFPFQIESLQMHLIITIHLTRQCKFVMDTLNKIPVSVYHDMNVDALAWSNAVQHNISRWQYICLNYSFCSSKIDFHLLSFVLSFFLSLVYTLQCPMVLLNKFTKLKLRFNWKTLNYFFLFYINFIIIVWLLLPLSPRVMYCL